MLMEQERTEIVEYLKMLITHGLTKGTGGNISVYSPELKLMAINPSGMVYFKLMPEDIVIVGSEEVPADWHPRYQSCVKTYEYHIFNADVPDPTRRRNTYFVSYPLNLEDMQKAASYLVGEHDFVSFCNIFMIKYKVFSRFCFKCMCLGCGRGCWRGVCP